MSEFAVKFESVHKKFRRGEIHDSLRDLIPAIALGLFRKSHAELTNDREFWALSDVSFQVRSGEAFAIIGPNGAGKSTILKLLSRVMQPTRGRVHLDGRLSALIELGAGFHPDLTGRENVYLNGSILGMTRREIRSKFGAIVEFASLGDFIDTPVKRYSSGMYARLGFSIAAHVDPEVLLVDEVLSVGDQVFQTRCIERMRQIRESGATVLFVSHNLQVVSELCGRAMLLDRGRVIDLGQTDNVMRSYMERTRTSRVTDKGKAGEVTGVVLRGEAGPQVNYRSGERAWLEIEITANSPLRNVTVGLEVRNDAHFQVLHTSAERLGLRNWDLEPGEIRRVRFEMHLHFARGTFHFGVVLLRTDSGEEFDRWFPASTFFVRDELDIKGCVNLYPSVVEIPASQIDETGT